MIGGGHLIGHIFARQACKSLGGGDAKMKAQFPPMIEVTPCTFDGDATGWRVSGEGVAGSKVVTKPTEPSSGSGASAIRIRRSTGWTKQLRCATSG